MLKLLYTFRWAFIWLLLITWLSTSPGVSLPGFTLISSDKLAHAAAYAVLTWLLLQGLPNAFKRWNRLPRHAWLCGFAIAYGALMEFVQATFFPYRVFEFDDMIANAIGALGAWSVFITMNYKR